MMQFFVRHMFEKGSGVDHFNVFFGNGKGWGVRGGGGGGTQSHF
jgi:hypothetical protein